MSLSLFLLLASAVVIGGIAGFALAGAWEYRRLLDCEREGQIDIDGRQYRLKRVN